MEQAHHHVTEHTKQTEVKKKTLIITTIPIFRIIKTIVTKNKMVNNGNSDDNKKMSKIRITVKR